jgi:hypothetical protein
LAAAEPQLATAKPAPPVKRIPPKPVKKDIKSLMKGVVVKKKPKQATASATKPAVESSKRPLEGGDEPSDKKHKP